MRKLENKAPWTQYEKLKLHPTNKNNDFEVVKLFYTCCKWDTLSICKGFNQNSKQIAMIMNILKERKHWVKCTICTRIIKSYEKKTYRKNNEGKKVNTLHIKLSSTGLFINNKNESHQCIWVRIHFYCLCPVLLLHLWVLRYFFSFGNVDA